jgi:hypothetical protein
MLSTADLRRNTALHVLDGIFFFAAVVCFSPELVIPKLISDLTDSRVLLGLVPLVYWLGFSLPQTARARTVEGLAYKKPTVLVAVAAQRVGWVVLLGSLFAHWGPASLIVLYLAIAAASLGSGFVVPAWTDWFAKTVPPHAWVRVLSWRWAASALVAVGLGALIRWTMGACEPPLRYQVLLGCAVAFYALSILSLVLIHELPEHGLPQQRATRWRDHYRELARIAFRRVEFRRFLLGLALVSAPWLATMAFLVKYSDTWPAAHDANLGLFAALFGVSSATGSLLAASLSSRRGSMGPFKLYPLAPIAAMLAAATSPSPGVLSLVYCLMGLAKGAEAASILPAAFRFAGPYRRSAYCALTFTSLGLSWALVPFAAGVLLSWHVLTYRTLFVACSLLALIGWILFLTARGDAAPELPQGKAQHHPALAPPADSPV